MFERFRETFNGRPLDATSQILKSMTRFDFNHLLPALLQVEDRMSMAHGLEFGCHCWTPKSSNLSRPFRPR